MLRIMVVEDNPVNQEYLLLALRPHGECQAASSGEEAVRALRQALLKNRPFQVIFLDIVLPGISGLQALEQFRALEDEHNMPEDSRARVIVTTALDDDRTASRAFIQGHAVSYMTKPFQVRDIEEELKKLGLLPA